MKKLILAAALLAGSCTGTPQKGTVHVSAVLPSVEALEPYTRAGIEADPDLTVQQKMVLGQEVTVLLETLREAKPAEPE
jgi:hypothetical protein